jgi:hypothetical protein
MHEITICYNNEYIDLLQIHKVLVTMSHAQSFDPNAKVLGAVILAVSQAINSDELIPILEKHQLTDIEPEKWYLAKTWFDTLNEVAANKNGAMNLVDAALRVSAMIPQAANDGTIKGAFITANETYMMNHLGYIGEIHVDSSNEREITISAHSPYPDDYLYGAFYGHARRHAHTGEDLRIFREHPYVYRIEW